MKSPLGIHLHNPGFGNGLLDMIPKEQVTKERKICHQNLKFYASEDHVKKVKKTN